MSGRRLHHVLSITAAQLGTTGTSHSWPRVKSFSSRVQRPGRVRGGRGGISLRCRRGLSVRAQPDLEAWARGVGMFLCKKRNANPVDPCARRKPGEFVGRSVVRAEGSGVMPQDRSNGSSTRGSRNDAALASSTPNVLSRRGRLVSRFGQNHVKSLPHEPIFCTGGEEVDPIFPMSPSSV